MPAVAILTMQGSKYKRLIEGTDTYIFSGEVYSRYASLAQSMEKECKTTRWYRKCVIDLEMQGIISTYESGKGIRGHTKLIKLVYPADKIKATVEKSLFKEEMV